MNREDIIRMARGAGFTVDEADFVTAPKTIRMGFQLELERFAALVAAAEREACSTRAHIKPEKPTCKDCLHDEQPEQPFNPDWSLLEATQESLREHMATLHKLKAALKLALEALEYLRKPIAQGWEAETQQEKRDQAITAIRSALADSALDKMAENAREIGLDYEPAQQQEPVAWMDAEGDVYKIEPPKGWCPPHAPLYISPPRSKPWVGLTDEQPVSEADELPNGLVPLQKENGRLVYAACMDPNARHYKWLMWRHPDGQWVSKRKLEDWEVMQVEDQEHYGIVQEAAHGIKGDA